MTDNSTKASGRFQHTGLFVLASVLWLLAEAVAGYLLYDKSWDTTAYYLISLVFELSMFIPAAVFMIVKRISLPALFGRAKASQIASAALLGMLMIPVSIAFTSAWAFIVMLTGGRLPQESMPAPETALQYLAAFAVLGLAAPLVEEPMMRGITLEGQAGVLGRNKAVLFTGLIFALLHGQFIGLPALLLAGVVLTALAWHSGSLWPPIALHFTYNVSTLIIDSLRNLFIKGFGGMADSAAPEPMQLAEFLVGTIVWAFIALPFAAACGAVLWGFWRYTPKALRPKPDVNIKWSFGMAWPWLVAVFLLLLYIVFDVLQIYGIINL